MDSIEKAKSGSLNISSFRLQRRTRRERKFVCTCCKDKFDSTSELTKHLKAKHPDYKYSCKKCTKTFATKNGQYKHLLLHSGKRYSCNTCGNFFYWKCELKDHMQKHTAKPAQHVSCPVRGCKKTNSSKHALQCILETIITPHQLLFVISLTRTEKFVERNLKLKHCTNSTSPTPIQKDSRLVVDSISHGPKNAMNTKISVPFVVN